MYQEFAKIGQDLFLSHITTSHGGNMSVRVGDRISITRRGSMLGRLTERDIIDTGLEQNDSMITLASTEIGVHRAIYKATSALAIIHAHPPYGVTLSLTRDEIIPVDSESSYAIHKVPVVSTQHTIGSKEVEKIIPKVLRSYKIAMLRGHGTFAIGQFLEEAYQWTSAFEASCQMIYLFENLQIKKKEYRKDSEKYSQW